MVHKKYNYTTKYLLELYKKHKGNLSNIKRELNLSDVHNIPLKTIWKWYSKLGLRGKGKKGREKKYTLEYLKELYNTYNGNFTEIAKILKEDPRNMPHFYKELGLKGKGKRGRKGKININKEEVYKTLYKKHNGNISQIAKELKITKQAAHQFCKVIKLKGLGNSR